MNVVSEGRLWDAGDHRRLFLCVHRLSCNKDEKRGNNVHTSPQGSQR